MQRSTTVNPSTAFSHRAGEQPTSAQALRVKPLVHALALALLAGGAADAAHAQRAFSGAWFAAKGAVQNQAVQTGRLPNGTLASSLTNPAAQQQKANEQLSRSISNLNLAARGIAAQQAAQTAARAAAIAAGSAVPDGLGEGGLKVDTNSLTAGWINANGPLQTTADGQTNVTVAQTADKAILNWETFNVGQNTTLQFQQQKDWSVLNRVNDPLARPSEIRGQIKADGTVLIVNRNGILFSGSSQINTRNLAAAAVGMTDAQFKKGIYSEAQGNGFVPTFANDLATGAGSFSHAAATAGVAVEAGAKIATHVPQSVTEGGGYVLLAGREVNNAGQIQTASGQTTLAAGDSFVIRKGAATDANQQSSTRGNEVSVLLNNVSGASGAGQVGNTGLIHAPLGDISLVGHTVAQAGVLLGSTSVNTRGTIHLSATGDALAQVRLAPGSLTALLLDDRGATALDVQRAALIKESANASEGLYNRRDQSLVQIVSAGDVEFANASLTLATGGQLAVDAARRTLVADGALLDVSGAAGVRVAMESNNVLVNVQGSEQRDAPVNRDDKSLNNGNIWVDRRNLVLVPAGTNGYETDRWYTAGGLLEVSGYLNTGGHSVQEWAASGGSVIFSGGEVVTRAGSVINVSGGSLDVATGYVNQTWLKGSDGRLYNASNAPGDLLYEGIYKGFENTHQRWGASTTEYFFNPLIAPARRLENGYTVGRDAGRVVVGTQNATLEGSLDTAAYQGPRQTRLRDTGLDGYQQAQTAAARRGQLVIGGLAPVYDTATGSLLDSPTSIVGEVTLGDSAIGSLGHIGLDAAWLSALELGDLQVYARFGVAVDGALSVANGGGIALHATQVDVNADLVARGGSIVLGNMVSRREPGKSGASETPSSSFLPYGYAERTRIAGGVTLDARGVWNNLALDAAETAGLPYIDGGRVTLRSGGHVELMAGSTVDVSSGATWGVDGKLSGGRGGSVTLAAGVTGGNGSVVLDGAVRGHGVKGGGALVIEHGTLVSIGGAVAQPVETLAAGAAGTLPLRLAGDYLVQPGETIPLSFSVTLKVIAPGREAPPDTSAQVDRSNPITLQADWVLPVTVAVGDNYFYEGATLPAGTVVTTITTLPAGYVLPAEVFPTGIPISEKTTIHQAGSVANSQVTIPAGTRIPVGSTLPVAVAVQPFLELDTALFKSGFSSYAVTGRDGLQVVGGTHLSVSMPVLRVDAAAARQLPGGAEPSGALSLWLPPLQQDDAARGEVSLRGGADLLLAAGSIYGTGGLQMAEGSRISVDPGRSVTLTGNDQVTIEGRIDARGGRISILGGASGTNLDAQPIAALDSRSLWIGERAVLDASGQAFTGVAANGRAFGQLLDGGTIELGGRHDLESSTTGSFNGFLVVRSGAQLDASGTRGTVYVPGLGSTTLASNGGAISFGAANGIFIDGDLRAQAGGVGALGGTLALKLETPSYATVDRAYKGEGVRDVVRVPRELVIEQVYGGSGLAGSLQVGQMHDSLAYGHARYGVDAIHAGGFDTASLYVNGLLSFDGDIDLRMNQALYLTASGVGLSTAAARDSQVRLAAPYLRLSGSTGREGLGQIMPNPVFGSGNVSGASGRLGTPLVADNAGLLLSAGTMDIVGEVGMGARGAIVRNVDEDLVVQRDAFGTVRLESQGDLRLRGANFFSPGNTTLAAAQVYGNGSVVVGLTSTVNGWGGIERSFDVNRRLDIERMGTALAPMPYSVFDTMSFAAATVNQGGVLRAPLGSIRLGEAGSNGYTGVVNLLPGGITSVSANGLVMPYGGTVDGLLYNYNGADVVHASIGTEPKVEFQTHAVNAQAGAVLDLSGGGELKGAAFLQGRGGSTDARLNPLVQMGADGFTLPRLATNPVYAIVPGAQALSAPLGAEKGAGDPAIGRQITIGAGVPGLPPGTYTLLPSTYALLPGAFRVELNGLATGSTVFGTTSAMRNGSWSTAARLGLANTGTSNVMPTQVVLTPADTLRTYSQFNETTYADFALQRAAREGVPRPLLERDGKALSLNIAAPGQSGSFGLPHLVFDATVLGTPGESGRGTVARLLGSLNYEILADGAMPAAGFDGVSVHASALNSIGAARLEIGGRLTSTYVDERTGTLQKANVIDVLAGSTHNIVLRAGAMLQAADVFLMTGSTLGGITLEQGAGISTLGRGVSGYGGEQGYIYQPGTHSVLALSNGQLDMLAPMVPGQYTPTQGAGAIEIGICAAGSTCTGETRLFSEGTIATATDNRFVLGEAVRYGTRNLALSLGGINVGSAQELAGAAARGALPAGMVLNQQVIDRLLLGDTSTGAPALEALSFTARESINFFGDVALSTYDASGQSALQRLVLGTPAIYGHGDADAVARIHTDTLIWTGARTPAGSIVANGPGTGAGHLVVDAREIVFGYGPRTQPDTVRDHDRVALGFANVRLNASERVTATHKGTLAVYQSQGAWDPVTKAFERSGGNVFISTPLMTGTAGSVNRITAGGDIHIGGASAESASIKVALAESLGAEIALDSRGGNLVLDTAVLLPSGKISLSAQGDVRLADGAQLDLAGRKIDFFDVSKYSWGGDVLVDSRAGHVKQPAGSRIDLSAENNRAGRLGVVATQGDVSLAGRIEGGSSGRYDAGGTEVPYLAGRIDVHGRTVADFAGLNTRLTESGLTGGRSFRLGEGDLAIGHEVKAHEINVSLDKGRLSVSGTLDASGEQAGSIRLSARDGVTLAGTAVLDASADVLRRDSYGKPIDAPNRAVIEVDSGSGLLAIASGARMDLRVAGSDTNYGTVALNAPRVGGNDVAIDAAGTVAIEGARSIQVNAFVTDDTAAAGTESTTDGKSYQVIDQAYLDRLHSQNNTFINAALANGALMNGKLAGLRAHGDAFHLRPGVEVVANMAINADGNLHVDGDIDLSAHRYASVNPYTPLTGVRGSGEAGALVIRAQGDLDVFGSISDGFDGARLQSSFDSVGWVLTAGRQHWASDVVVPHGGLVTLDAGTVFNSGKVLNYDLPIDAMQMAAGTLLPSRAVLTEPLVLARGTVLGAAVHDAAGQLLYAAGAVLADAVTLPADTRLDAGFRLPARAYIGAMVWPAGVALPAPPVGNSVMLSSATALGKGALIPSDTDVKLPDGALTVDLRPRNADGDQGRIWALAPLLPGGSQSFDITLVAGADTAAADRLATRRDGRGSLRFSDMHYGMGAERTPVPGTGVPAVYRWADDVDAATWEQNGLSGVTPGAIMRDDELQLLFDYGYVSASPLELNEWGLGNTVALESEGTPPDYSFQARPVREQAPSVVRTGTGDLRLVSAGDIATSSLFGIYTAGTPSASLATAGEADPYNQRRSRLNGAVLGEFGAPFEMLVDGGSNSLYEAWYPEAGGNLLLRAGGDVTGDSAGSNVSRGLGSPLGFPVQALSSTASVGNWLWRQGSGSVAGEGDVQVPTAWWINFGTYVPSHAAGAEFGMSVYPRLIGFTGFGTLGGGNLVLEAGGNAGMLQSRGNAGGTDFARSSGLNLAVASTGRVTPGGELVLTGGGDLDIRIGGGLNADPALRSFTGSDYEPVANAFPQRDVHRLDINGSFTSLRGALRLEAGAVGGLELHYGSRQDPKESRPYDVYTATAATAAGGPVLVLGDAGVRIEARGDLVLGNATDAGRVPQYNGGTPFGANGRWYEGNGWSWFSLWTPSTAVDLLSAGGHLTPTLAMQDRSGAGDGAATDLDHLYPSVLRAAAASGSIFYGRLIKAESVATNNDPFTPGVVLAPSPVSEQFAGSRSGQLELLAAGSIYGNGTVFSASGGDPTALPDPFNPGFVGRGDMGLQVREAFHNAAADARAPGALFVAPQNGGAGQVYPLFTFTPPTASGHVYVGQAPARYYAVDGDLVGLRMGRIVYRGANSAQGSDGALTTWYDGGGAVAIRAGRDIVNAGTALGAYDNLGETYGSAGGALGWFTYVNDANPSIPPRIYPQSDGTSRGNLIVHTSADDVSLVQAGRDIRYSSFYMAGPGLLDMAAGRDVYMADKAELRSLGPVVNVTPGDRSSGAGISVAAGLGAKGADWAGFAARYLDPARLIDAALPLADQPGKAVRIYNGAITLGQWLARDFGYTGDEAGTEAFLVTQQQVLDTRRAAALASGGTAANRSLLREFKLESQLHLVNWLTQRFGGANGRGLHFDAATMDARAFFSTLPPEQQSAFLRNVYYAELRAAGREYNDADGKRFGSYLRGREAIETLLPSKDAQGNTIAYKGDLTMFSNALYFTQFVDSIATWRPRPGVTYLSEAEWTAAGKPSYDVPFYKINDAGIHTDFGGDISLMAPGGRTLIGVDGGYAPGAGSGVLTQGEGDINIFSLNDILMGQSRVFTTFGGNILAWSAEGDINAGRGSKTTVVYTPSRRLYDDMGLVSLSPNTPSTGAGIATLNPIPEVPPGDIDLIAPLGTIDAGEAGIRVSGNVNLAAMQVLNAENIDVQGEAVGIPVIAAVNIGALTNASAAASQAAVAAQDVVQRERAAARQSLPSIFTVRVLGFGTEPMEQAPAGNTPARSQQVSYNAQGVVQVLGAGALSDSEMQALTVAERRALGR